MVKRDANPDGRLGSRQQASGTNCSSGENTNLVAEYKSASTYQYGMCAFNDCLGCIVHSYPPGKRTCHCGQQTTPLPVRRAGRPPPFKRSGMTPTHVDYQAGWEQFHS